MVKQFVLAGLYPHADLIVAADGEVVHIIES